MICLSAQTVIRDGKTVVQIDAQVSEQELYEDAPSTLEGIRAIFRTGRLPRKGMRLPSAPFLLVIPNDPREVVIESVEAWEGDFPGKRFVLITKGMPGDLGWLVGKNLELRPLLDPNPSSTEENAASRLSDLTEALHDAST